MPGSRRPFQITSFLGAALLFLVQPLLAKQILPWFGGGSAVWSACLLFFQLGLVAGYAYAHFTRTLQLRTQAIVHIALLCVAAIFLPVGPSDAWKPPDGENLVGRVLLLLLANVGLPYVLLAATAPLIQDWDARRGRTSVPLDSNAEMTGDSTAERPERPYRLYVLSNVGSLLALLAYPLVLEPSLPLATHHVIWSVTFVVFAATCAWCAWVATRTTAPAIVPASSTITTPDVAIAEIDLDARPLPAFVRVASWLLLSAIGSGLLLATTSLLTQDVAAMPLIWVVPLALYLVTFIVAFAGWYLRPFWALTYLGLLFATMYAFRQSAEAQALVQAIALLSAGFAGQMICHGELVRLRPPLERLTTFYLALAVGGALGGAFVAIAAPLWLNTNNELPILHLSVVAIAAVLWTWTIAGRAGMFARILAPPAALALVAIPGAQALASSPSSTTQVVEQERGFYGVVRVSDEPSQGIRRLHHGRILHGLQFTTPILQSVATTYYAEGSGINLAMRQHPKRRAGEPLVIGVVGLGTGTVAALAEAGDRVRFFEIDPVVIELSQRHFTFAAESPADVEIAPGDARLTLERDLAHGATQRYDVLVLDAFSGDAIPVHLLTAEALDIYDRVLAPDGVLVVHVSNRFLELRPVVRGLAEPSGFEVLEIYHSGSARARATSSTWMLVTRNQALAEALRPNARDTSEAFPPIRWTDDYSSLLAVWKPRQ